jgi:hypothetical protein
MDLLEKVFDSKNIKIVTTIMKGEFEEEITPYSIQNTEMFCPISKDCKITLGELVVQGGGDDLYGSRQPYI